VTIILEIVHEEFLKKNRFKLHYIETWLGHRFNTEIMSNVVIIK